VIKLDSPLAELGVDHIDALLPTEKQSVLRQSSMVSRPALIRLARRTATARRLI
jgi:hypothetical protein